MTNPILVTGASGTIGSELVKQLRARGANFAVMSSKSGEGKVHGDFSNSLTLQNAFTGVHTLFLLFPLTPDSFQMAQKAVAAAKAAGVRHIVRSSGAGAAAGSQIAIADLQGRIDSLIENSGIAYTLLRPASFMQNWVNFYAGQLKDGRYAAPNGSAGISVIDVRDIAEVAAEVLTNPADHAGKIYTLTGGEALTTGQQVALIAKATGRAIRYDDISEQEAEADLRSWGLPDVMVSYFMSLSWVYKQGWAAGISGDVERLTGHAPRSFKAFIEENVSAWA